MKLRLLLLFLVSIISIDLYADDQSNKQNKSLNAAIEQSREVKKLLYPKLDEILLNQDKLNFTNFENILSKLMFVVNEKLDQKLIAEVWLYSIVNYVDSRFRQSFGPQASRMSKEEQDLRNVVFKIENTYPKFLNIGTQILRTTPYQAHETVVITDYVFFLNLSSYVAQLLKDSMLSSENVTEFFNENLREFSGQNIAKEIAKIIFLSERGLVYYSNTYGAQSSLENNISAINTALAINSLGIEHISKANFSYLTKLSCAKEFKN